VDNSLWLRHRVSCGGSGADNRFVRTESRATAIPYTISVRGFRVLVRVQPGNTGLGASVR